jgi:hypothetical protein
LSDTAFGLCERREASADRMLRGDTSTMRDWEVSGTFDDR